jgi:hypothetical protein
LPQSISGDAATDGKQIAHQFEHVGARRLLIDEASQIRQPAYAEIHRDPFVGEQGNE